MPVDRRALPPAALLANLLFWASVFGFAALRPDYSHLTDATSELGVWGAPNMWAFNVLGYMLPGALIAICGVALARAAAAGPVLAVLLAAPGIGLLISGVFPGDLAHMRSFTTMAHIAGSLVGLVWLPALAVLAWRTRRSHPMLAVFAVLWLVLELAAFGLYGVLWSRALVQRLTFAVWLSWYPVGALALGAAVRSERRTAT